MSGQNPHPGDMHHGQISVGCPTPPPPLGLDIDRCISLNQTLYFASLAYYERIYESGKPVLIKLFHSG